MLAAVLVAVAGLTGPAQGTVQRAPLARLPPASPTVTSANPAEVTEGETVTITLTGTNITNGLVLVLGTGITVTPVTGATGTSGIVRVTVAANAAPGSRTLVARIGNRNINQPVTIAIRARVLGRPGGLLGGARSQPALPQPPPAQSARGGQVVAPPPSGVRIVAPKLLMFAGAKVQYDKRNCLDNVIPCLTPDRTIYAQPNDTRQDYFWWNIDQVPNSTAVRWQIIYTAVPPAELVNELESGGCRPERRPRRQAGRGLGRPQGDRAPAGHRAVSDPDWHGEQVEREQGGWIAGPGRPRERFPGERGQRVGAPAESVLPRHPAAIGRQPGRFRAAGRRHPGHLRVPAPDRAARAAPGHPRPRAEHPGDEVRLGAIRLHQEMAVGLRGSAA